MVRGAAGILLEDVVNALETHRVGVGVGFGEAGEEVVDFTTSDVDVGIAAADKHRKVAPKPGCELRWIVAIGLRQKSASDRLRTTFSPSGRFGGSLPAVRSEWIAEASELWILAASLELI